MTSAFSPDPQWERLTASVKAAVRWAAAIAATRCSAPCDSVDLLAGIMMSHLRDSPGRQLLDHFGIPAGAVLARDGATAPRLDPVRAAMDGLPADQPPPAGPDVEQVLAAAGGGQPPAKGGDGLVSLRMLFGAMLSSQTAVAAALRTQLSRRGVDAEAVVASYPEFLAGREPYDAYLKRRHPYHPQAVQLPAVQPDLPRERRAPKDPAADPPDLVGIQAEVDAFAYLIASKRLTPPLAIGLFGEWGGGKSYFLRSLQRRIDALVGEQAAPSTARPPAALPYYTGVVQVEYNAWQYVEGDLWSSLLEHLFRNLALAGDTSDDLLAARQREVIDELRRTGDEHDAARLEYGQLEAKRRVAAAEVHRRRQEREVKLAELRRRREEQQPRITVSDRLRRTVDEVLRRTGVAAATGEAEELAAELRRAREAARSAGPVLAPLRSAGGRGYLVAVLGLLALTPLTAWLLESLDLSAVTTAAGAVATLLATAAGYVRLGSNAVDKIVKEIEDVQAELDGELAAGRARLDEELAEARQAVDAVDAQLATADATERELAAEAAALEVTLAQTTPGRLLGEFIAERLGSDDYRGRLGVPALVRRDLARLSTLIQQRHGAGTPADTEAAPGADAGAAPGAGTKAGAPAGAGEHGIDRIVLYIDDLDRCPTRLVVDVLQAVHLLLAFPLFVVVVAVDARWLSQSLRQHYQQLQGADAAPEDFLEKIFQVPFWVRPLPAAARSRMITGLITPSLAGAGTAPAAGAGPRNDVIDIADADLPELRRLLASFGDTQGDDPPWLEAAALPVTRQELDWMQRAAPLLGDTPRAIKRFTNVYLLARSVGRGHGWRAPSSGQLVILLAIATGLPGLADLVLMKLETATSPYSLRDAISSGPDPAETPDPTTQRNNLEQWLDQDPATGSVDFAGLTDWIDLIRRFRFHR